MIQAPRKRCEGFLVALAFSQMFNLLCERADNVHGSLLPYHVRVLWDEAANTGQVPQLEKIVAAIRSRGQSESYSQNNQRLGRELLYWLMKSSVAQ